MQLLPLLISVRQKIPLQCLSAQKPAIPSTSSYSFHLLLRCTASKLALRLSVYIFPIFPGANPVKPRVDIKSVTAQETHERHVEPSGHVHRQAARRGDRAHDGHPGHEALLQDLEAAAAADHDDVPAQRQPPLQERPPYELVGGVVASHVLSERDQVPLRVEERRRVQAARHLEEPLRLPELLRQGVDSLRSNLRTRWDHGAAAQLELLQALLAAHAAGARGVEMTLQRAKIVVPSAPQLHVHDVVPLLGVEVSVHAVADLLYVIGGGEDALAVEKAGG